MNRTILQLITSALILFLLPISSCSVKGDEILEYSPDGILYKKYYLTEDSLLNGPLLTYYEDGKTLFEKANYKNGKLTGQRILYFKNEQPEIIETYSDDLLTDTLYVYFESGQIKRKAPYINGVLTGTLISYYESGIIKEEVTLKENMENGPFKEFHENGNLKWEGQFLNGENEFGLLTEYNDKGEMIKKMQCDSLAICRTVWKIDEENL